MDTFASPFTFDDAAASGARIAVVGVGGGGGNAVNNMVQKGIQGVSFLAINTDNQALDNSAAQTRIQAGRKLTSGLGAGARPQIGAEAVEESRTDIEQALQGYDMVFITAGMGGGTGTGGAPVVAQIARDLKILTVGVVTKPFGCEGVKRRTFADQGIQLLKQHVDTIIVIPNESLLDAYPDATLLEAFGKVDDVLYEATRGISDLITTHGLVNLDFADVKTTIKDGGLALMGSATASGENRAEKAATAAITSPLLDGISISGARNVLVNITAGRNLGVREATRATDVIHQEAGDEVEVILGTVIDDTMGDELRVTVIATGFDQDHALPPVLPPDTRTAAPAPTRTALSTPTAFAQQPITTPVRPSGYGPRTQPAQDMRYRGEDNLSMLDKPAFERRQPAGGSPTGSLHYEPDPSGRTLRRSLDEQDRTTPSRPAEPAAFLRKMMD